MKLPAVMAALALGMTLIVLAAYWIEPPAVATAAEGAAAYPCCGQAHPQFDTMLAAGSGAARGAHIWGLSFVYGALIVAFFVCSILLGIRRNGRIDVAALRWIAAGAVLYALAYAGMMFAYREYMNAEALATFGALPVPTAWMMYAMWPVPFCFLLIFVLGFRRFIWNEASDEAFQQIVADKRAAEGNG